MKKKELPRRVYTSAKNVRFMLEDEEADDCYLNFATIVENFDDVEFISKEEHDQIVNRLEIKYDALITEEVYDEALKKIKEQFLLCHSYPYCQFYGCLDCKFERKIDKK